MRKIKFRGKRKNGHEMLIGDLNYISNGVFIFPRDGNSPLNSPDWFEVIPETVGQFTGLYDKDGKEIWEGDIVRYDFLYDNGVVEGRPDIGFVAFGKCSSVGGSTIGFGITKPNYSLFRLLDWDISVISSIHDNPELLKPQDNDNTGI